MLTTRLMALCMTIIATFATSLISNADTIPPSPAPYVMSPTSCGELGPAILGLVEHTSNAILEATKAGFAADSLRNGADYKTVEDSSAKVHNEVLEAYMLLGPITTANVPSANITSATVSLGSEAQGELQVAQQLAFLALTYERTVNATRSRRRRLWEAAPFLLVAPVVAGGYMSGVAGAHTATSQTTGTINGEAFSATTTTQDYAEANALSAAISARQDERKQALEMYTPQVGNLVYVIHPLTDRWIAACRAAHQLPSAPPKPSRSGDIRMAKHALSKGASADYALKLFMR